MRAWCVYALASLAWLTRPVAGRAQSAKVEYQLQVRDENGRIVYRGFQSVSESVPHCEIQVAGDTAKALGFYEHAVVADPEWFEARVNLSAQCYRAGRYDEALAHLQKALELDPRSALAYSNFGAVLLGIRDDRAAERAARRSVELDPLLAAGR